MRKKVEPAASFDQLRTRLGREERRPDEDSPIVNTSSIEENDPRSSLDEPVSVDELDSSLLHGIESEGERRSRFGLDSVDFHLFGCNMRPEAIERCQL